MTEPGDELTLFLVKLLEGIVDGVGDPQHPRHRAESYYDLEERISPYTGRYLNAAGGDVAHHERDYGLAQFLERMEAEGLLTNELD